MRPRPFRLVAMFFVSLFAAVPLHAQQADALSRVFAEIGSGQIHVLDLTHPLDEQSPYWPEGQAASPYHASVVATFEREGYFARLITMPEHFGTHMDAPAHFDRNGLSVDRIPAENFLVSAVVINVSHEAEANADDRLRREDVEQWGNANGKIPQRVAVLVRTGWGARWPSQKDYMNQDAQGVLHFPGLSVEAAKYLISTAHPVAIGIDTASIDYGPSKNFEVHHLTMSAGLYHLENLTHLGGLPPRGAYIIALPMKLAGGSGSPARVVALIPKALFRGR